MKRSGEFWLNCLSDDVREKWLNNYDPVFFNSYHSTYYIPLSNYLRKEMVFNTFMTEAFDWSNSSEGVKYWERILQTDEKKLIRNYKLKQLGL